VVIFHAVLTSVDSGVTLRVVRSIAGQNPLPTAIFCSSLLRSSSSSESWKNKHSSPTRVALDSSSCVTAVCVHIQPTQMHITQM